MIYIRRDKAIELLIAAYIERNKFFNRAPDELLHIILRWGHVGFGNMDNAQLCKKLKEFRHTEFEPAVGDAPGDTSPADYTVVPTDFEPEDNTPDPRDYDRELKDTKPYFTKKRI